MTRHVVSSCFLVIAEGTLPLEVELTSEESRDIVSDPAIRHGEPRCSISLTMAAGQHINTEVVGASVGVYAKRKMS
jgi:hypothetical protein